MVEKRQGLGRVKRFGVRYGRTTRYQRAAIERLEQASTKCPYCHKDKVVKLSKGIWHCTKCMNKFTGQAFTFSAKPAMAMLPPIEKVLAETQQRPVEEPEETEEAA
jgi:ribosomal protein L37AE/L43A